MIEHLDGVPWCDAPAPPKRHDHYGHTVAMTADMHIVERCPCGAFRWDGRGWLHIDKPRVAKPRVAKPTRWWLR